MAQNTGAKMSIDLTSGTILRIVLFAVLLWFLYIVLDVIIMLFAAIVLAAAIEPIANYFQKYRIPRALSVALVYLVVFLVFFSMVTLMIEPLTTQIRQLTQATPDIINSLHRFVSLIPQYNETAVVHYVQSALLRFSGDITNLGAGLFEQTRSLLAGLFTVVFVFVLTFYLVVEKDALKKFVRLITPIVHLPYVDHVISRAQQQVGRWVLAQLALGIIVGTIVWLSSLALGLPYALLLGLTAGVFEIVPFIGPILWGILGVVIGFSQSIFLGVAVLVVYIIIQQIETHVLVPNIMRRAIGLHPLVTIIAILLGGRLAGVVGIMLSVPMATVLSVVLSDIFSTSHPDLND